MFKPLRDKILELAITGKLVPQMDSEPAVEQIGPAPAKDEEPFALPEKWKWVRLEYLSLASFSGGTPSKDKSDYWNGSIPWASIKDLSVDSEELSATKDHITAKGLANSSTKLVEANNVIVGMRMGLNKVVINTIPLAINQDLRAFYLDCSLIAPKFFVKFYRTLKFEGAGTTVKGIRKDELMGMFVPLPPLEEQRRIVSKLDDIMGNLERMDQAYTELSGPMAKHFKNLVLQQAISGQLVPQLDSEPVVEQIGLAPAKEEEPFALPEKWKWVRLDQVAQYRPSVKADDELEVSFAPLEKLSDGYDNFFCFDLIERWSKVKKGFSRFCNGDVIFAKIHPSFQNRKSAVVTRAHNGIGCGSTEYCVFRCKEPLDNQYLLWFFKSEYFISFGKNTFKGTVGQQRVNLDVITTMLFPLPPLEEQRRIVARIEELFGDVDKLLEWQQFA